MAEHEAAAKAGRGAGPAPEERETPAGEAVTGGGGPDPEAGNEPENQAPGSSACGSQAGGEPRARARAKAQLLTRWRSFPPRTLEALEHLLDEGLARAEQAEPEVLTVMNPVSRPMRLRLAPIAADADLDRMYHRASAELSLSEDGRCFLVYRQRDGGDYAVLWSGATSLPEALLARLPEPLAAALLDTDLDDA